MKRAIELLVIILGIIAVIYFGKPKLAILYNNYGLDFYNKGQYDSAISYFKISLQLEPYSLITHLNLARVYNKKKMMAETEEEYIKILKLDPNCIDAYLELTNAYLAQEKYYDALNFIKKAKDSLVLTKGNKKKLDTFFSRVIKDSLNKGLILFLAGDKDRAYDILKNIIEVDPDMSTARYLLGYCYYSEHKYAEARAELQTAVSLEPSNWKAYKLLGDIYFEVGEYEMAIDYYKKALWLSKDNAVLNNDLGLAFMRLGRYSEATQYLEESLRLSPESLDIRYNLANTYRDNQMFDKAISEYHKIIIYKPDYIGIHNNIADIYLAKGKKPEALNEYRKEIEICSYKLLSKGDDPVTLNNLARAHNGIGDYNNAKIFIEKAISLKPDYPDFYLTLSKTQEGIGEREAALETMAKARTLFGNSDTSYIEQDVERVKRSLGISTEKKKIPLHRVYLKNKRFIDGKIVRETADYLCLEVYLRSATGTVNLYRSDIESVASIDEITE
jgi:tetratricopeptide (TPR) repeat protein